LHHRNGAIPYASLLDTRTRWVSLDVFAQSTVGRLTTASYSHTYRTADGFSLMFLSVIVIARDGNWTPSNGTIYVCFGQYRLELSLIIRPGSFLMYYSLPRPPRHNPPSCHQQTTDIWRCHEFDTYFCYYDCATNWEACDAQ
jgi:hypothetical protein